MNIQQNMEQPGDLHGTIRILILLSSILLFLGLIFGFIAWNRACNIRNREIRLETMKIHWKLDSLSVSRKN